MKKSVLAILPLFLLAMTKIDGQPVKSKWNNKDKGTFNINYRQIGVFPKDSENKIPNKLLIGIVVGCYEMNETGRIAVKKNIRINGNVYSTSDTLHFDESDTSKGKPGYFSIWASEGSYVITVPEDNGHYDVETEMCFLTNGAVYQYDIYLVRKNELKKIRKQR